MHRFYAIFCLVIFPIVISAIKLEEDGWRFDESDAENPPYLVYYSDTPIKTDKLAVAEGDLMVHPTHDLMCLPMQVVKRALDKKQILTFYLNSAGPTSFSPGLMSYKGYVCEDESFDCRGGYQEDEAKHVEFLPFAALIPLTKNIAKNLSSSSEGQMISTVSVSLGKGCVFISPSDRSEHSELDSLVSYDPKEKSIHEVITQVLKEQKAPILSFTPPSFGFNGFFIVTPVTYSGEPFCLWSIKDIYPGDLRLPEEQKIACFDSAPFDMIYTHVAPMQFSAKILERRRGDYLQNEYFTYFIKACFFDEFIDFKSFLNATKESVYLFSEKRKFDPNIKASIDEKISRYQKFYELWRFEKELVLKEKKSVFRSSSFIETLISSHDLPLEDLKECLSAIAEPFDFHALLLPLSFSVVEDDFYGMLEKPFYQWQLSSQTSQGKFTPHFNNYSGFNPVSKMSIDLTRNKERSLAPLVKFIAPYKSLARQQVEEAYTSFKKRYDLVDASS